MGVAERVRLAHTVGAEGGPRDLSALFGARLAMPFTNVREWIRFVGGIEQAVPPIGLLTWDGA